MGSQGAVYPIRVQLVARWVATRCPELEISARHPNKGFSSGLTAMREYKSGLQRMGRMNVIDIVGVNA
jgi:hypothetical protein